MEHLARSASRHEESARQILCSLATTPIPHLLIHKDLQMATFSLIAALLDRRFSPSLPPTGLLPDAKENARSEMESDRETVVTPVLGAISEHSDGVGIILALFASNIPQVRRWACAFVSKASLQLHHHFRKVFGEAVIQAVCNLAGDPQEIIAVHPIRTLEQIVQADYLCSYDIVATALFDRMWHCGNTRVISEACCLVSSLVTRGFTVDYILDEAGIGKLVKLIGSQIDSTIVLSILSALSEHPAGAAAIMKTDWPGRIPHLLPGETEAAPSTSQPGCRLIDNLLTHEPTRAGHLWAVAVTEMLIILWEEDINRDLPEILAEDRGYRAMSALRRIARHKHGAQALVAERMSARIPMFLHSKRGYLKSDTFSLIKILAGHGLWFSILGKATLEKLDFLIRDVLSAGLNSSASELSNRRTTYTSDAIDALTDIVQHPSGALAVMASTLPESCVPFLLQHSDRDLRHKAYAFISSLKKPEF
ncbi:hypothetical protein FB45DRAFT_927616 [Roridomyces roridus]|uniref:Uncharacterized protein n=1 Tax=Roridomyces roridus TaxID=1738132 RepID=A0AAD7BJA9_9AGAR|nr:hypothetical protein FB45DRAFT_927616 [Roridomyces roridus]